MQSPSSTNQRVNLSDTIAGPQQTLTCCICHSNNNADCENLLSCAGCRRLYHGLCHVPQVEAIVIRQRNLTWYCTKCNEARGARWQLGPLSAPLPMANDGNKSLQNPSKRARTISETGGNSGGPFTQERKRSHHIRKVEDHNLTLGRTNQVLRDQVELLKRGADNLIRETLRDRENLWQNRQKLMRDQEHLGQNEKGLDQLKVQLGEALARLHQDQEQLRRDQEQLRQDRQELAQLSDASKPALLNAKSHEQRIVKLQETADIFCKEVDDRDKMIKDRDKTIDDRTHVLVEVRTQLEGLKKDMAEIREQVQHSERDLVKTQAQLSDREIDLSEAQWLIWQRNDDVKTLRKHLEDRDGRLVKIQAELMNRDHEAEKLREQLKNLSKDLAWAQEGNQDRDGKLERAHAEVQEQANRLAGIMSIVNKSFLPTPDLEDIRSPPRPPPPPHSSPAGRT